MKTNDNKPMTAEEFFGAPAPVRNYEAELNEAAMAYVDCIVEMRAEVAKGHMTETRGDEEIQARLKILGLAAIRLAEARGQKIN